MRRRALAAVALLLLAACGSRVSPEEIAAHGGDSEEQELGGGGVASGDLEPGSFDDGGGAGGDSSPGSSGFAASDSGTTSGSGGGASVVPRSTSPGTEGPGVTPKEIFVGVGVLENGAAANEAIGSNIQTGDQRRQYEIIFEDVNKRGGIGGRKAVPVFFSLDALSGKSADVQSQAACAHFTQDNKVFAALGGAYDTFLECMTKAGTVQITSDLTSSSMQRFETFPRYVEVSSPNLERQAAAWPPELNAMGYFDRGAKVGVLSYDDPHFTRAIDRALLPGLKKLGHEPVVNLVGRPDSSGGLAQVAADAESAAFRFQAQGVTHVLILDERANLTMFFMRSAESQRFNPRYGFNTQNAVGFLTSTDPPQVNPNQLRRAVGIGWAPFMDEPQAPDSAGNEPMQRCTKLMLDNGVEFGDSNVQAIAMQQCDNVWFLDTVIEMGGPVTPDQFMRNVASLGDRYLSPHNFRNRFDASRRDGTGGLKRMAYFEDCTCVRYTSGLLDL